LSASKAHPRYRGKVPPQSMVSVLEGHDSADEGYESMLRGQVLHLFELLATITVPTQLALSTRGTAGGGAGGGGAEKGSSASGAVNAAFDDPPATDKASRHTRAKSLSRRHGMGVLKEIAQQQTAAEVAASKEDTPKGEATLKSLIDDFDAAMDAAESLMTVEDLNWAGLFHHRYLVSNRLLKSSETEHIKSVVEVFLSSSSIGEEASAACRRQASKLMQYIVSHTADPDGALLGLAPSEELARRIRAALDDVYGENATRPELREKILGWGANGELCPATAGLSHGMLVVANLPEDGLRFVRFSRMEPTRTHMLQVWKNANEKESILFDVANGVFFLDETMRALLGSDAKAVGRLVYNPLRPLHAAVDEVMERRVAAQLRANGVDLFLLNLSEDQLASDSLDLSAYDETGELKTSGQALCTKLLSLFDTEKKKLLAMRGAMKQSEIEEAMAEVSERVEAFMSEADLSSLFQPTRAMEIDAACALGLRGVAAFQQNLDRHLDHVEELINYVIVNYKKLADVKLRPELRNGKGSTLRGRSLSRGSAKNFLAANKDKIEPGSPLLNRNAKDGGVASAAASPVAPGTPGNRKKTLFGLFQKKE
jgi:hypothetical protein